jgi:hypothetical protein
MCEFGIASPSVRVTQTNADHFAERLQLVEPDFNSADDPNPLNFFLSLDFSSANYTFSG